MKKVLLLVALCAVWSATNAESVTLKSSKTSSKDTEFTYYDGVNWESVTIKPGKSVVVENMVPDEVVVYTDKKSGAGAVFTCNFGTEKKVSVIN